MADPNVAVVGIRKARRITREARLAGRSLSEGSKCVIGDDQGRLELAEALGLFHRDLDSVQWKVLREAEKKDLEQFEANAEAAEESIETAESLIKCQGLPMDILGAEYSLNRSQLKFYFKAPHRVDFRGLLKDLAGEFSTRIELEQVGPRSAASIIGGQGRCGREFCCRRFLSDPGPIPMEIAQKQELSVSPDRLTGGCGRLLCCLKYEYEDYVKSLQEMPDLGDEVQCPKGVGEVVSRNVQTRTVTVDLEDEEEKVELKNSELSPVE
ncbi:MAG: PSP1 domain-containing protein [Candidatus Bipolaricaulota bacterium]